LVEEGLVMFDIMNWILWVVKISWLIQEELNKIVKLDTVIVHPETIVPEMLKFVSWKPEDEKPLGKVKFTIEFLSVVSVDTKVKVYELLAATTRLLDDTPLYLRIIGLQVTLSPLLIWSTTLFMSE
jgi:hypothetical protein